MQLESNNENAASMGPYAQIVLFGDSLIQQSCSQDAGFALMPALQDYFIRRFDVINRGFSGYTSRQALDVLPQFMPTTRQADIHLMAVLLGANDSCLPTSPTGQYVPIEEYKRNLQTILQHEMVQAHGARLLLLTPPPVDEYLMDEDEYEMGLRNTRTAENTRQYAMACRDLGESLDVPVVDIWTAVVTKAGWKPGQTLPGDKTVPPNKIMHDLLRDGVHFRPNGYRLVYEAVREKLEEIWPDLVPERLHMNFPAWDSAAWKETQ